MTELIKFDFSKNVSSESTVSARRVYEVLEVRRDFTSWFKYHVKINGLVEGRDYFKVAYKDRHSDKDLDTLNLAYQDKGYGGDRKSVDYNI